MSEPELDGAMQDVLGRYLEIQHEEQELREEKATLQERIAAHMEQTGQTQWFPELEGEKLKVRCTRSTVFEYDEPTLRQRLGERYGAILGPDVRKIRANLGQVTPLLQPLLPLIGSPAPERVREAVEKGVVRAEEFAGAFRKTTRRLVAVSRVRPEPGQPAGDADED
jgi:hypothetical protein